MRTHPRSGYLPFLGLAFVIFLLSFLLARSPAAVGAPAGDETADPYVDQEAKQIIRLADDSLHQGTRCRQSLDQIRSLAKGAEKKEFFNSRASALAVLKAAWTYPGTPVATTEALDRFMALDPYPKGELLADLQLALARLSDCYAVEYFGVLTRLMSPRTRALLTKQEIQRDQHLILSYLLHETSSGPKFFHQVEKLVDLFDRSIRERLIVPGHETKIATENLTWRIRKIRSEDSERFHAIESSMSTYLPTDETGSEARSAALQDLSLQLGQAEEIQSDLGELVEVELENLDSPLEGPRIAHVESP